MTSVHACVLDCLGPVRQATFSRYNKLVEFRLYNTRPVFILLEKVVCKRYPGLPGNMLVREDFPTFYFAPNLWDHFFPFSMLPTNLGPRPIPAGRRSRRPRRTVAICLGRLGGPPLCGAFIRSPVQRLSARACARAQLPVARTNRSFKLQPKSFKILIELD